MSSQGLDIGALTAAFAGSSGSDTGLTAGQLQAGTGPADLSFLNLLMSMSGLGSIYDDTELNKAMVQELQESRDQRLAAVSNEASQSAADAALLRLKPRKSSAEDEGQLALDDEQLQAITGITPAWLQELLKLSPVPENQSGQHRHEGTDDNALQMQLKDIFSPPPPPVNLPLSMLQQLPNAAMAAATKASEGFGKSQTLSKDFVEMIQKAYQKQRPIRVSISDDTSLILKFTREGQVSAHFMASNMASEQFLKQHLSELRQRLDAKGLPIDQLTVQPDGQRRQQSSSGSDRDRSYRDAES